VHIGHADRPVLAVQSQCRIGDLTLGHHPHGQRVADVHHRAARGLSFGQPRRILTACGQGTGRQHDDDGREPRANHHLAPPFGLS
jgi:hypothetical protein